MQTPISQPASASARSRRAAYGAPDAPVMPRKMRIASLAAVLRFREELPQLVEIVLAEVLELRHHVVPELRGIRDIALEEVLVLRLPDRGEIRCADVRGARAEVRVALQAADLGEDLRALLGFGREPALLLRPDRHRRDYLGAERLPRRRSLVGEHTHRERGQH